MFFAKYPFDRQKLRMQFVYSHGKALQSINSFVQSGTATRWFQRDEGDVAAGWQVIRMGVSTYNTSLAAMGAYYTGRYGDPSHESDPLPIAAVTEAKKSKNVMNSRVQLEFDIEIEVKRYWVTPFLTVIVPVLLLVALTFVSYFIHPSQFDSRVTMHVTVFLSMTALQFVISDKLPSSSYATGVEELILIGYIIATISVPEAIIVSVLQAVGHKLALRKKRKIKKKRAKALGVDSPKSARSGSDSDSDSDSSSSSSDSGRDKDYLERGEGGHGGQGGSKVSPLPTKLKQRAKPRKSVAKLVYKASRPSYSSNLAAITDRVFFYTMLLVVIVACSLIFSNGSMMAHK